MITQTLLDKINAKLDSSETILEKFPIDCNFHHFKNGKKEPSSSHVWAVGSTWEFKGNSYQSVTVGDWRTGENFTVKSYDPSTETKQALTYAKKYIEEIEKVKQEEKDNRHKVCKEKWENIFNSLEGASNSKHGYVSRKRLKNNYRARARNETLLIPIEHPEYGFVGCQQIFKQDQKFVKYFTKGIRITGSYTRLTNFTIETTPLIYLCEGYATGASVHEATGKPVVICFNCNNIIPVIASIRKINKSIKIIIAGDDDHTNPKNPGRYKAELAAKQFSNTICRFPKFQNPDGLSDFNDLHVTESLDRVSEQLKISNSEFIEINPLGHHGGKYYYVNTQTSEIFSLTAARHSPDELIAQAPRRYWGQKYGFKRKGEEVTKSPDWDIVKDKLFQIQRDIGFFEAEKIRGVGGWIDKGKVVFNAGKFLFVDGVKEPISEHSLQTNYVYEARKNIDLDLAVQPTATDIDEFVECFSHVNYKNPGDYAYVIGTIILAQCPMFWDWRAHLWLTGSRGTGKTTVLSWLDKLIFTNGTGIIENATAAGIRGELGYSAVSCILDEAEAGTPEARRRMAQIMEQARQCSSNTGSKSLRGTADGGSVSFMLNSQFIMGSIQTSLNNAADVSRFNVIELDKSNPDVYPRMKKISQSFPALKKKLLSFTIKNAIRIKENQNIIQSELLKFNPAIDQRQSDQLSWPIAAFWTLTQPDLPDEYSLDLLFTTLQINNSDYIESNQADDEGDCLGAIYNVLGPERITIDDCIKTDRTNDLKYFGIRIMKKYSDTEFDVFFSAKNPNLRTALYNTEFHDYAKILRRLSECKASHRTVRISGLPKKGLIVKLNLSDSSDAIHNNDATQDESTVPF